jgi:predicted GIY-YIG superfamily endonuclease
MPLFRPLSAFEQTEVGNQSGVYLIRSSEGKVYIGISAFVCERVFENHLGALRARRHKIKKLQADFDRLGENAFEAWHIEPRQVDKGWAGMNDETLQRERWWIQSFHSAGVELYNVSGVPHSLHK